MRKALVESCVDGLRASFGLVKKPVAEEELHRLHDAGDYAGLVRCVQDALFLNVKIRLGLVNKGGPKDAPAWIEWPKTMPCYGSQAFQQTTVVVYLRKSHIREATFEAIVCTIAHELCHVVLGAVWHPLRWEEEAVDLVAMLLGFRDFYVTGSRSVYKRKRSWLERLTNKEPYTIRHLGYLTQEEVAYAASYMTFH
jgi:hypothetical protein